MFLFALSSLSLTPHYSSTSLLSWRLNLLTSLDNQFYGFCRAFSSSYSISSLCVDLICLCGLTTPSSHSLIISCFARSVYMISSLFRLRPVPSRPVVYLSDSALCQLYCSNVCLCWHFIISYCPSLSSLFLPLLTAPNWHSVFCSFSFSFIPYNYYFTFQSVHLSVDSCSLILL